MPSRITITKSSAASVTVDFKNEDGTAVDLTGLSSQFAIAALGVNVTGTVAAPATGRASFSIPAQSGVTDNALYDAQISLSGSAPIEVVAVGQEDGTALSTPLSLVVVQNDAAVVAGVGVSREAARQDAYVGEIEAPEVKTYHVDNRLVTARTINSVHMQSTTGTATAAVRVQRGLSLLPVASVSVSSTATTIETGLTNTAMQAGDSLLIVVSATTAENLRFSIGFVQ